MNLLPKNVLLTGLLSLMCAVTGCGGSPAPQPPQTAQNTDAAGHAKAEDKHDGWWCDEHGVPEEECAQCSAKIAADFQKKGDWCKQHDRPDSQCFLCHPEKLEEYAARYEAKYGKKPPKPETDETSEKESDGG